MDLADRLASSSGVLLVSPVRVSGLDAKKYAATPFIYLKVNTNSSCANGNARVHARARVKKNTNLAQPISLVF